MPERNIALPVPTVWRLFKRMKLDLRAHSDTRYLSRVSELKGVGRQGTSSC